jgi:hypothetical protein
MTDRSGVMTKAKMAAIALAEFLLGALITGQAPIRLHSENSDRDVDDE